MMHNTQFLGYVHPEVLIDLLKDAKPFASDLKADFEASIVETEKAVAPTTSSDASDIIDALYTAHGEYLAAFSQISLERLRETPAPSAELIALLSSETTEEDSPFEAPGRAAESLARYALHSSNLEKARQLMCLAARFFFELGPKSTTPVSNVAWGLLVVDIKAKAWALVHEDLVSLKSMADRIRSQNILTQTRNQTTHVQTIHRLWLLHYSILLAFAFDIDSENRERLVSFALETVLGDHNYVNILFSSQYSLWRYAFLLAVSRVDFGVANVEETEAYQSLKSFVSTCVSDEKVHPEEDVLIEIFRQTLEWNDVVRAGELVTLIKKESIFGKDVVLLRAGEQLIEKLGSMVDFVRGRVCE